MWANKCNYEQDVITIALLLKLLYTHGLVNNICRRVELPSTLPGRKTCQKYGLFYIILLKIQHLKCRIWLSKNRTRKPFNRNSRERKLYITWYSMWRIMRMRSSHETELQIQWGKSFSLCVNTRTIYSSLLSYQGIFSASGKRKGKKHRVQMELLSDVLGWYLAGMVSFSTEPGCLRRPWRLASHSLLST